MITDVQVAQLERALRDDSAFKQQFDTDPVAVTRAHGMGEIAEQFERWLADRSQLEQELPDAEAHGVSDKLNMQIATKPRLALVLLSSAVIASQLGWGRNGG